MTYRLFEAADYLRPYPAFADCDDHDTLRQWAVKKNNWQGPRARAVIVSDDGRFGTCPEMALTRRSAPSARIPTHRWSG